MKEADNEYRTHYKVQKNPYLSTTTFDNYNRIY